MKYICTVCNTQTRLFDRCTNGCGFVRIKKVDDEEFVKIYNKDVKQPSGDKPTIAFLTEDTQHITGGRYYAFFVATAMKAAGFDVFVYTNRTPLFLENFKDYELPEIVIFPTISNLDVQADFYVGSPIVGNEQAIRLGKKYRKPYYNMIFDPFPMMEKFRGKHNWIGWDNLIPSMRESDVNIISLCDTTSEYIYEWLNKREDQVIPIYPCINDRERDKTPNKLAKKNQVVFISRLDFHKMFDHVLHAVRDTDLDLKVITSIDAINSKVMIDRFHMNGRVEILRNITDEEKFKVIKESKVVINGAIFEGFGIWMTEAISCGVPVVCYDYPTFKEIEKFSGAKNIYFAQWNNGEDLRIKLQKAVEEKKYRKNSDKFNFEHMVDRVKEVFKFEPRIGVITIALNEDEYIDKSLRSIKDHPNIKKIAVVEGAVRKFAHAATDDGLSEDSTATKVYEVLFEENGHKIIYDRYGWAFDKSELRNRAIDLLGNSVDYVLVVDADELWKHEDIDRLIESFKQNMNKSVFWPKFYHFWKKQDLIAIGSQWDKPLFRCFKFSDKTLRFKEHHLAPRGKDGILVNEKGEVFLDDVFVYHYGAMKSEKRIKDKLEFYKKRDKQLFVKDTWTDWKPGKPTQWTHGGGTVEKFEGTHPKESGL